MLVKLFVWSSWVNAILSAAMAGFVLLSRPMSRIKFLWAASCISVSLWSFGVGLMCWSGDKETAYLGMLILNASSVFIPIFLLHLTLTLINRNSLFLPASYALGALLIIANFTHNLSDVRPIAWFAFYTTPKWPYYHVYTFHMYFFFGLLELYLWLAARKSNPLIKKQLLLIFWGTAIAFLGGQMTFLPVFEVKVFPIGAFFSPIYLIAVGYGMLKYQFLDFRLVLKKFILAVLIFGVLTLLVFPIVWTVLDILIDSHRDALPEIGVLIGGVSLLLSAGPIIYTYIIRHTYWLKSHLTTGLTHELKSPLSSIQSAVEIISNELKTSNPDKMKISEYNDMISKNSARLEVFIRDLLHLAKVQEGDISLDKKPFDLEKIIIKNIEMYQVQAMQKGLLLTHKTNSPVSLFADQNKVDQVISNLLSNSIKFTEKGRIHIESFTNGSEVVCRVTDTGSGIPSKELHRVFERFYQVNKSSKGSGLGLTLAKAWVEAHGGRIWAESEGEGKGTTVVFSLPR